MHKKLYYLLMTAGSFAMVIMLGICVVLVLGIAGCSSFPPFTPDKDIDLTVPPKITEEIVCCIPDKDFPLSCGGWTVCEFNSKGELT